MATSPKEATIVDGIIRALKTQVGVYWVKNHGTAYGRRGVPDITGCIHGRFFGLEVKRPGGNHPVSPLQKLELQKIANAGGIAAVVDSVEDALHVLRLA